MVLKLGSSDLRTGWWRQAAAGFAPLSAGCRVDSADPVEEALLGTLAAVRRRERRSRCYLRSLWRPKPFRWSACCLQEHVYVTSNSPGFCGVHLPRHPLTLLLRSALRDGYGLRVCSCFLIMRKLGSPLAQQIHSQHTCRSNVAVVPLAPGRSSQSSLLIALPDAWHTIFRYLRASPMSPMRWHH